MDKTEYVKVYKLIRDSHVWCYGNMDCLETLDCSKCTKELKRDCYNETFKKVIE